MSEPRPTGGYLSWASGVSGAASIVEPVQLYKNAGFQPNTSLPAQYQNWAWNKVFQWTKFLDDRVSYEWAVVDDFNGYTMAAQWTGTTGVSLSAPTTSGDRDKAIISRTTTDGTETLWLYRNANPAPLDWIMQWWAYPQARGTGTAQTVLGFQDAPHFYAGASGNWQLRDVGEFLTADSGVPVASGYTKLEIRYQQSNNQLSAAINDVDFYGASHAMMFGGVNDPVRVSVTRVGLDVVCWIDRFKFGLRK